MTTYLDALVPYRQRELIAEAERQRLVRAARAASGSVRADGGKSAGTRPVGATWRRARSVGRFVAAGRRLVVAVR